MTIWGRKEGGRQVARTQERSGGKIGTHRQTEETDLSVEKERVTAVSPGEIAWLDAILQRGQLNPDLREAVSWLHLRAPSVKNHQ